MHNIINIHCAFAFTALSKKNAQGSVECKESEERGLIINHRLGGNLRFLVSNSISQFDILPSELGLNQNFFTADVTENIISMKLEANSGS